MPENTDDKKRRSVESKVQAKKVANLERALKEERLALTAIATVFVKTHGNPDALFAALDRMVTAAADNPRVKPRVKQTLIDGHRILDRALAIHRGKPQPLFDADENRPKQGVVNPSEVRQLTEPEGDEQQGLPLNGGGVEEAVAAMEERGALTRRIDDAIVRLVRENEPMTDVELYDVYCADADTPKVPWDVFYGHRTDLTRRGRVIDNGERRFVRGRMRPLWDLIERTALT